MTSLERGLTRIICYLATFTGEEIWHLVHRYGSGVYDVLFFWVVLTSSFWVFVEF